MTAARSREALPVSSPLRPPRLCASPFFPISPLAVRLRASRLLSHFSAASAPLREPLFSHSSAPSAPLREPSPVPFLCSLCASARALFFSISPRSPRLCASPILLHLSAPLREPYSSPSLRGLCASARAPLLPSLRGLRASARALFFSISPRLCASPILLHLSAASAPLRELAFPPCLCGLCAFARASLPSAA